MAQIKYDKDQVDSFFKFVEWLGRSYVKLGPNTWIHKYADQRNSSNFIRIENLWNQYHEQAEILKIEKWENPQK